jgi:hypothetical protein
VVVLSRSNKEGCPDMRICVIVAILDVRYLRDETDNIVSFQLTAGRVRNVLFRRM